MSPITTHVLDLVLGKPAEGIEVDLDLQDPKGGLKHVAKGRTDEDGRIKDWLPEGYTLPVGVFRMTFRTGPYFETHKTQGFYPQVVVTFEVREKRHYHVPLLLSPFGYSTYRGS